MVECIMIVGSVIQPQRLILSKVCKKEFKSSYQIGIVFLHFWPYRVHISLDSIGLVPAGR
jgi:hypothetical protein